MSVRALLGAVALAALALGAAEAQPVTVIGPVVSGNCVAFNSTTVLRDGGPCALGTVTNIATVAPITGGPITSAGTIGCATCITSGAALAANRLVLGAGLQSSTVLGALGTTTTVLHGNAAGAPTFGPVSLAADVSGILPVSNGGTNCSAAALGCFNNITGFTAAGATGTTSTNLVFSASPALTGVPTAPTATLGTNTTQIATTAFVQSAVGTPTLTANSNLTSGFTAGQILYSDGTKLQASNAKVTAAGTLTIPAGNYLSLVLDTTSTAGSCVQFSSSCYLRGFTGNNVFVGLLAGPSALGTYTATDNTVLGGSALNAVTTGDLNVAIGNETMIKTTTGGSNTCVGFETCHENLVGGGIAALGANAGYFVTKSYVTALGYNALGSGTGSPNDIAIGVGALLIDSGTVGNNIGIGQNAGQTMTTGDSNTFIGYSSGYGITTGRANVVIGAQGSALAAGLSNSIIFGDGDGNYRANYNVTHANSWTLSGSVYLRDATAGFYLPKITATAAAPGADTGRIELVCGTNAGSAKLIAYAGTSVTAATILDNIGSGVSGC